jgi:hypothetical protein
MHIVVVFERLQEFTDFRQLRLAQIGKILRDIAQLAGHHRPVIRREPLRHRSRRRAIRDETRALAVRGNIIVLIVS